MASIDLLLYMHTCTDVLITHCGEVLHECVGLMTIRNQEKSQCLTEGEMASIDLLLDMHMHYTQM